MDRKNKACWNCFCYKAFYTKGLCYFDKLDYGVCNRHKKTVDKHEQCEEWRSNYKFRAQRERVAMDKLNGIMDGIVDIRQILFEEKEEQKQETEK